MNNTFKFLTVILLLSSSSFGQEINKRIDSIIKNNYERNSNIGISVGFIRDNKEYYTAYGKLNMESDININKNTIFEIASITKILTSNLAAQAVIENKINLDDFIDDYLPDSYVLHRNFQNKIRISDLASHQSGLKDLDFGKLLELNPQQPLGNVTTKTLSDLVNNSTELIDYGQYRYSTIGYTLLGQILETVYNKNFDELIREKIIDKLQLTNTFTKEFNVGNRTTGYNQNGNVQEFLKWNITAPAGLVKSSASDMILFLKVILNEEDVVSKAAKMTEKTFYKKGGRELGLGTNIFKDDKNTLYLKSGDSMGQSSIICYNRIENWGIIILLNQRNSEMRQDLLNKIYETVLK
jgi:CubicO group peptidase (beta-lactamase class C family)